MDIRLILCDDQAEAAAAKGFLRAAGAAVTEEPCGDLSVHTVQGTPPANMSFPSECQKMGNFTLVIGRWA